MQSTLKVQGLSLSSRNRGGRELRHIISPGFAKSGTTYLHALFAQIPQVSTPRAGKEINVFLSGDSDDYLTNFDVDPLLHLITVDFSPNYLGVWTRKFRRNILEKIKRQIPEALVIVAIRSPVSRAVSHYWHLIQSFGRFGVGRYNTKNRDIKQIYAHTIESSIAADIPVGMDIAEALEDVHSVFGSENVIHFFLENDARDIGPFMKRVGASLGFELELPMAQSRRVANAKRPLPKIFFAERHRNEISVDGVTFVLPENSIYLAVERAHELILDVDPLTGRAWEKASNCWTSFLDGDLLRRLHEIHFSSVSSRLMSILAETADGDRAPDYRVLVPQEMSIARAEYDQKFLNENIGGAGRASLRDV